jgi:threonyl-tRNA synthetase
MYVEAHPMKILLVHCDYFSYTTTKKTKFAEEVADECKSCGIKDALVVFATVEKSDEKNMDSVLGRGVEEIDTDAKRVGAKRLVIYPFVHLSADVGNPEIAKILIDALHAKLAAMGYEVRKAPFGWEKVFSLTSKGHPLSESFKTV